MSFNFDNIDKDKIPQTFRDIQGFFLCLNHYMEVNSNVQCHFNFNLILDSIFDIFVRVMF